MKFFDRKKEERKTDYRTRAEYYEAVFGGNRFIDSLSAYISQGKLIKIDKSFVSTEVQYLFTELKNDLRGMRINDYTNHLERLQIIQNDLNRQITICLNSPLAISDNLASLNKVFKTLGDFYSEIQKQNSEYFEGFDFEVVNLADDLKSK